MQRNRQRVGKGKGGSYRVFEGKVWNVCPMEGVIHVSCMLEAGLSGHRLTDYPCLIYLNASKNVFMCAIGMEETAASKVRVSKVV